MPILGLNNTRDIHMKDKKIILDTNKLLGFRLVDTKQLHGVASGVKPGRVGAKIGNKTGQKGG